MVTSDTHICKDPRPHEKQTIIKTFFGIEYDQVGTRAATFDEYFAFYRQETALLLIGAGSNWESCWTFPIRTHRQVCGVVEVLRRNTTSSDHNVIREEVRGKLSLPQSGDFEIEDLAINLALRLWLMINFREAEQIGLGTGRPCIEWSDGYSLCALIESLFEKSTTELSPVQKRLHPNFKAANMVSICRLNIRWTASLEDHLRLDREHNTLWIFAFRYYLEMAQTSASQRIADVFPIPAKLLDETNRTLDLLFPSWDRGTKRMMQRLDLDFHRVHHRERVLDLKHFPFWRDRLLQLYEDVYLAPPEGWSQLWYDRRDPQKFWTFWVAFVVLGLTVIGTIAALLQAALQFKQNSCN